MLTTEDGTGLTGAESYASVLDADGYATNRLIDTWQAVTDNAVKEAALRRGTEYIDAEYGLRFKGRKLLTTQALEFPRIEVYLPKADEEYPSNIVPINVSRACIELAIISLSGPLYSIEDPTRVVVEEAKGVGPLSKRLRYSEPETIQRLYFQVSRLLLPFIENFGVLRSFRV